MKTDKGEMKMENLSWGMVLLVQRCEEVRILDEVRLAVEVIWVESLFREV